jgi:hypothetical protein
MKTQLILAAAVVVVQAGCEQQQQSARDDAMHQETEYNEASVRDAWDQNARNAIVLQRIIHDHHFEPATAVLNDLGKRQVQVLAEAYGNQAVRINVWRGEQPAELYDRRVDVVREALVTRGMDAAKLTFGDGMPDGSGISSELIWNAYKQAAEASQRTTTSTNGSGGSNGRMSDYSQSGRQR